MAAGPGLGAWTVEPLRAAARAGLGARRARRGRRAPAPRRRGGDAARAARRRAARARPRARRRRPARTACPVLREALALAEPEERGELSLELGRALFAHGYFADACTAFEAGLARRRGPARGVAANSKSSSRRSPCSTSRSCAASAGSTRSARGCPARRSRAWIEVARDRRRRRRAARRGRRSRTSSDRAALAAALVALQAAGRYERADAEWTGVAESARAAGEFETLRMAIALRAMVRLRMGRVADVEADLRGLIEWVAELELPLRAYRTALPSVVSPLVDALLERGQLDEAGHWPALTGPRGRPARGVRVHVHARHARAAAARAGAGLGRAAPRPRGRAPPARVGLPQPRLHRLRVDARAGAARRAGAPRRRSTPATSRSTVPARSARCASRAWRCARSARSRATEPRSSRPPTSSNRSQARLEHARALVALGGREPLKQALEIAERLGATALADAGPRRARQDRRQTAPQRAHRHRRAHRRPAPRRPARRRRPHQPRDRRDAVPDREDRRRAPRRRVPQARHQLTGATRRRDRVGSAPCP